MGRINEVKRGIQLREWAEQYRVYRESGKTVSQWCRDNRLSQAVFYYRLKKIREAALDSAESKEISGSGSNECHEIVSVGDFKPTGDNSEQSIKITSGDISVEMPADSSPEMIKAVIGGTEAMLKEANVSQIYIVTGYTDMRRSIDGLAAIVQQNYDMEPCSGSLFLFCGRKRSRLKALLWEEDGFLLLYKRLDNGAFQWPRISLKQGS